MNVAGSDASLARSAPNAPRVGAAPRTRTRRLARALVRAALTALFLCLLVRQLDLAEAWRQIAGADPRYFAAAVLVLVLDRLLQAVKWYPLLAIQTRVIGLRRAVRAYLAAYAASFLLPASIGGDVLRAVALGRAHGVVPEIGASIAMERLLGIVALVLMNLAAVVVVALGASPRLEGLLEWAVALAVGGLVAVGLSLSRRARRLVVRYLPTRASGRGAGLLARFGRGYATYREYPSVLAAVAILSVLETGLIVGILWLLALAIGAAITLPMLLVATPITLVLYRLPLTYWGFGVADGGFAFLLRELYGIPVATAVSVSVLFRLVELCVAIPGALLWRDLVGEARRAQAATAAATPARAGS